MADVYSHYVQPPLVFGDHGDRKPLLCPCGSEYLHLRSAAFLANAEGRPYAVLAFNCEGCGEKKQLFVENDKGHTTITWDLVGVEAAP